VIDAIVYHKSRRMLVWTERTTLNTTTSNSISAPAQTTNQHTILPVVAVYAQHISGNRLGGSAQLLLQGAPPGELRLLQDAVAFFPKRSHGLMMRDSYTWTLETLELQVHFWGVGTLDTSNLPSEDLRRYEVLHRELILPALHRTGPNAAAMLCTASHPNNGQVVILDPRGVVSVLGVDGRTNKLYTAEVCTLHKFNPGKLGRTPQLFVHRHTLGVLGGRGSTLYLLKNGAVIEAGLSVQKDQLVWYSAAGTVCTMGLWSPHGGIWEVRAEPLPMQTNRVVDVVADGPSAKELAAKVCLDWGDTLSAKYALDALTELNTLYEQGYIGAGATNNKLAGADEDGAGPAMAGPAECMSVREYAAKVVRLLPLIRSVQGPAACIALLFDKPQLHAELRKEVLASEALAANDTPLKRMVAPLLERYTELAHAQRATLTGQQWVAGRKSTVATREGGLASTINAMLAWSDTEASGHVVRATIEQHARDSPTEVLQCIFNHLHLSDVLVEGFPDVAIFSASVDDATKVGFQLVPDRWEAGQALELHRDNRHPLFEIVCRLLHVHFPDRLLAFVKFSAELNSFGGSSADYALYSLSALNALPAVAASVGGAVMADVQPTAAPVGVAAVGGGGSPAASSVAHSEVAALAGELSIGLKLLVRMALWTEAVGYLTHQVDEGSLDRATHLELFRYLVGALVQHGQLEQFSGRLFTSAGSAGQLQPDTYHLSDLLAVLRARLPPLQLNKKNVPHLLARPTDLTIGCMQGVLGRMLKAEALESDAFLFISTEPA
jgi:hypothetical protein